MHGVEFMKEIICMIGPSGAGKSTAAKILEREFGYYYFAPFQYVLRIKNEIKLRSNYEYSINDLLVAITQHYEKGYNEFISTLLNKIGNNKIVFDSCVNKNHLSLVMNKFDSVLFLTITNSFVNRLNRVARRDANKNYPMDTIKNNLSMTDQHERKLGLGDLMLFSDWTIYSDESCDLLGAISDFLKNCNPTTKEEKVLQLTSDFQDLRNIRVNNKICDDFLENCMDSLDYGC